MRILVAPDKFKHSLGSRAVAEAIAAGLRDALPAAEIELLPIADGGEGTAEAIAAACAGEWVTCAGHDAIGRPIQTRYYRLDAPDFAVIEMSEAAGSWRLAPTELDPDRASTYGVGEMLLDASRIGSAEIIIGLGGSATNDGGFGMARAIGFRFEDGNAKELCGNVLELRHLKHIRSPANLHLGHIIAAADVRAPLLGANGATFTYALQKGARANELPAFEEALAQLADVVAQDLGHDFGGEAGAGAAGGLGFGLVSFAGAQIRSGFAVVAELINLSSAVERADVVITGEGRLDAQTAQGKAPAGVAEIARAAGKRVFAIVGSMADDVRLASMFESVSVLATPPITSAETMRRTAELLRAHACKLARKIQ